MSKRIRICRNLKSQTTEIQLWGLPGSVKVVVEGRLSSRQRRALGLTFFRHIRPWIEYFRMRGYVMHWDDPRFDLGLLEARGVNLFESQTASTAAGDFGFRIRMQRLGIGLSQEELARKAEINRCHLSEIERGLVLPNRSTREKLWQALLANAFPCPEYYARCPEYPDDDRA